MAVYKLQCCSKRQNMLCHFSKHGSLSSWIKWKFNWGYKYIIEYFARPTSGTPNFTIWRFLMALTILWTQIRAIISFRASWRVTFCYKTLLLPSQRAFLGIGMSALPMSTIWWEWKIFSKGLEICVKIGRE